MSNTEQPNKVHRTWVFTQNNPTPEHKQFWSNIMVRAITVGEEVGENGTPHLQGYVTFIRGYRLSQLKKLQPEAHFEPARAADAANYALKDGNILRHEVSEKKRKATEYIWDAIKRGKKNVEMYEEHAPSVFHYRAINNARNDYLATTVDWVVPEVHWRWGPTGTGKTRYVHEQYSDDLSVVNISGGFFEGYDLPKRTVLIDDLRPGDIKYPFLLRLTDRYPGVSIPVKGGWCEWKPERIYITSNQPPEAFAPYDESSEQLVRRMTSITKVE